MMDFSSSTAATFLNLTNLGNKSRNTEINLAVATTSHKIFMVLCSLSLGMHDYLNTAPVGWPRQFKLEPQSLRWHHYLVLSQYIQELGDRV